MVTGGVRTDTDRLQKIKRRDRQTPLQAKKEDLERYQVKFKDPIKLKNAAVTHSPDHNVGHIFA